MIVFAICFILVASVMQLCSFLLRILKKLSGMGIQPLVPILAAGEILSADPSFPFLSLSSLDNIFPQVIAARIVKSWPVCNQSDNVTLR